MNTEAFVMVWCNEIWKLQVDAAWCLQILYKT